RQHPDKRVADLVARGDGRLLVKAGFLLGRPRPQKAVGLCRGVVVAPADGTFDRWPRSLQAENLALQWTHVDRNADPVRSVGAPGTEREHRACAAQRLPLEDHAGDARARPPRAPPPARWRSPTARRCPPLRPGARAPRVRASTRRYGSPAPPPSVSAAPTVSSEIRDSTRRASATSSQRTV